MAQPSGGVEGEDAWRASRTVVRGAVTGRGEPGCREASVCVWASRDPWQDAKRRAHGSNLDLVSVGRPVAEKWCRIKASLGTRADVHSLRRQGCHRGASSPSPQLGLSGPLEPKQEHERLSAQLPRPDQGKVPSPVESKRERDTRTFTHVLTLIRDARTPHPHAAFPGCSAQPLPLQPLPP